MAQPDTPEGAVATQQNINGNEVAGDNQAQQQQAQQPGMFSILKGLVIRVVLFYFITSYFRKWNDPAPSSGPDTQVSVNKIAATNVLHDGSLLDLYVYINELETNNFDTKTLLWMKEDLQYGDWTSGPTLDGTYSHPFSFPTSQKLQNNGSVYIHAYVVKSGFSPDPAAGENRYYNSMTVGISQQLNKYRKKKYKKTSNLLTGKSELTEEEIKKAETMTVEIVSYFHPNLTINIIHDFTHWSRGAVPPPLDEFIEFSPVGDTYKPILFFNSYWNFNKDYEQINETVDVINMTLTFQPLTLFKWQMYAAQAMKNKWAGAALFNSLNQGDEEEEDQDAMKEMFLETSPYLLGLTVVVSILHSIFEMLAFKNDVQFWNNRKSLEGLSVRSVFFNVAQAVIVLLYVMDNETNFVIKVSCFVGLGIELWKITKVMDVSINWDRRIMGVPTLNLKHRSTYVESQTKKFDEMAFRYLGMAFFPLLGGYCVYSLLYHEHKGWYSFVLSMLYGFLLTFGFIMMTPQLFINYKMKSVAHLPWRMLTYKALNTFIDDIFAFIIKMPTLYRLGCLRDDVVFFIFLYQRYMYPIDPKRVNEFGTSQEILEEFEKKKKLTGGEVAATPAIENNGEAEPPKAIEDKKKD